MLHYSSLYSSLVVTRQFQRLRKRSTNLHIPFPQYLSPINQKQVDSHHWAHCTENANSCNKYIFNDTPYSLQFDKMKQRLAHLMHSTQHQNADEQTRHFPLPNAATIGARNLYSPRLPQYLHNRINLCKLCVLVLKTN